MFKKSRIGQALMLAFGGTVVLGALPTQALAQRVEITGSSLRRIDAEQALPVTVLKLDDLTKQGVTSTEQAISFITANQSNFGASSAIGGTTGGKSEADLRGLGAPSGTFANKTLVLLNGRRLSNHSFDAAAVDLNAIPLAAIDRIEVLRDSASAIYGTDAIGGVINFILKKEFVGLTLSGQYDKPQASGGGDTQRISASGGFGSLATDRFNISASIDWRKQNVLIAADRAYADSGVIGTSRAALTNGTSGTAFPGDLNGFEPSGPLCAPPSSLPSNTNPDNTGPFTSCRYDFTRDIDIITQNEQITGIIRGSWAIDPNNVATFEYLNANNKSTARVAAAPTSTLMPASSPFFPAGAPQTQVIVPDFAGGDGVATVAGGAANWRQVPLGKRTSGDDTTTTRTMLSFEGLISAWDYRAAVGNTENKSTASVKRGYPNDGLIQQGVWNGLINPFGDQNAAGQAALDAAQVMASTLVGKAKTNFVDATISNTSLWKLPAGPVGMAFGFEYRDEKSSFVAQPITAELGSLGIDPDSSTSGSRNSAAVFAEFVFPVIKDLDITLAARYDRYSDFGNTFNPKVAVRYVPTKELLLRGSYSTGFRAPTLYEIYQPLSTTFTTDNYDDPLLCPGGVPVPGASAGVVCGQQVLQRQGGPGGVGLPPETLQPEKSKAYSFGLAFQPINNLSFGVDFWQIKVEQSIGPLPEQAVFGDPVQYAGNFVRCSQIPATGAGITRSDVDACTGFPGIGFDPIAFIDGQTQNLGELVTNGIDLSANYTTDATAYGRFGLNMAGTYVTRFEYQRQAGGEFIDAKGRYSDNAPIFRWQHTLAATWSGGPWVGVLGQRYKTGYLDQDGVNKVGSYSVWDLSGTWTGIKNLSVTAGIINLFDRDPPLTVQNTTFQRGYDPRFTSPLGRTFFVGASYSFL